MTLEVRTDDLGLWRVYDEGRPVTGPTSDVYEALHVSLPRYEARRREALECAEGCCGCCRSAEDLGCRACGCGGKEASP